MAKGDISADGLAAEGFGESLWRVFLVGACGSGEEDRLGGLDGPASPERDLFNPDACWGEGFGLEALDGPAFEGDGPA